MGLAMPFGVNGIAEGDLFGTFQFVYFNTRMIPWDGIHAVVIA